MLDSVLTIPAYRRKCRVDFPLLKMSCSRLNPQLFHYTPPLLVVINLLASSIFNRLSAQKKVDQLHHSIIYVWIDVISATMLPPKRCLLLSDSSPMSGVITRIQLSFFKVQLCSYDLICESNETTAIWMAILGRSCKLYRYEC